ncbi:MAG: lipoyl(octanoyl) transferase LipB [Candidatus Acidiferrales bacterium]
MGRRDHLKSASEKTCWVVDLGLMAYQPAFDLQRRIVSARKRGAVPDVLLLCEHPHVITLGRNGKQEHLLASSHLLRQMGVEFHSSDRGGDITYHGPGQIVGYPILNLAAIRRDVAWYVRQLEEAMIRATADFGVVAGRNEGMTGVWVDGSAGASGEANHGTGHAAAAEKLAAIGVHLSRWVTSHGFAYNVSTDLRYFELIVPCGIADKRATSLERLLGRSMRREEVASRIAAHLGDVFERDMQPVSRENLEDALQECEAPAAHAIA